MLELQEHISQVEDSLLPTDQEGGKGGCGLEGSNKKVNIDEGKIESSSDSESKSPGENTEGNKQVHVSEYMGCLQRQMLELQNEIKQMQADPWHQNDGKDSDGNRVEDDNNNKENIDNRTIPSSPDGHKNVLHKVESVKWNTSTSRSPLLPRTLKPPMARSSAPNSPLAVKSPNAKSLKNEQQALRSTPLSPSFNKGGASFMSKSRTHEESDNHEDSTTSNKVLRLKALFEAADSHKSGPMSECPVQEKPRKAPEVDLEDLQLVSADGKLDIDDTSGFDVPTAPEGSFS